MVNKMNLEEWEEFWAYLVGDLSIAIQVGPNHLDNVGEFLEWKRQEWIKLHETYPAVGMVKAGQKIIRDLSESPVKDEENV